MGLMIVSISPRFTFPRGQRLDHLGCPKFLCLFALLFLRCHSSIFSASFFDFAWTVFRIRFLTANRQEWCEVYVLIPSSLPQDAGLIAPLDGLGYIAREQAQ